LAFGTVNPAGDLSVRDGLARPVDALRLSTLQGRKKRSPNRSVKPRLALLHFVS
jgi:hypothetical protein